MLKPETKILRRAGMHYALLDRRGLRVFAPVNAARIALRKSCARTRPPRLSLLPPPVRAVTDVSEPHELGPQNSCRCHRTSVTARSACTHPFASTSKCSQRLHTKGFLELKLTSVRVATYVCDLQARQTSLRPLRVYTIGEMKVIWPAQPHALHHHAPQQDSLKFG